MTLARVRSVKALFAGLVPALGDYRDLVVVAGGMARDLYAYLPGYQDLGLAGQQTLDVDIALEDPLRVIGEQRLHELLIAAGLRYQTKDDYRVRPPMGLILTPVAGRYFPAGLKRPTERDPHIEFITQLRSPAGDSNAKPQGDALIAYTLDYVALLLADPVVVEVPRAGKVRIPHPLAYIIQKGLIRPERQRTGQNFQKDTADAFKTVISMRSHWPSWSDVFSAWSGHRMYGPWMGTIKQLWSALYDSPTGPGCREIAVAFPQYPSAIASRVMREFRAALGH